MDFVYGHVIWILCMLCVNMSLHVLYFSNACLFIDFNFISLYLYFVLSSITKKGGDWSASRPVDAIGKFR